jgi:hypothetical protein
MDWAGSVSPYAQVHFPISLRIFQKVSIHIQLGFESLFESVQTLKLDELCQVWIQIVKDQGRIVEGEGGG